VAFRNTRGRQTSRHRLTTASDTVYDWPIRIWHWAFAAALTVSLTTGLSGEIGWMDTHLSSGYAVIALALFRLGWALWGGRHHRIAAYRLSPGRLWKQLRGHHDDPSAAHTPLGALLALVLWLAVAIQAGTGLFASDDIFTEGPFARRVSDGAVDGATWVHVRLQWLVLGLIVTHLTAMAWYGFVRRDALVYGMFTGRKPGPAAEPQQRLGRALATLIGAAALVYTALEYL